MNINMDANAQWGCPALEPAQRADICAFFVLTFFFFFLFIPAFESVFPLRMILKETQTQGWCRLGSILTSHWIAYWFSIRSRTGQSTAILGSTVRRLSPPKMEDLSRQEKASVRWSASEYLIFYFHVNWHIWERIHFPSLLFTKTAVSSTTGVVLLLSDFFTSLGNWFRRSAQSTSAPAVDSTAIKVGITPSFVFCFWSINHKIV